MRPLRVTSNRTFSHRGHVLASDVAMKARTQGSAPATVVILVQRDV